MSQDFEQVTPAHARASRVAPVSQRRLRVIIWVIAALVVIVGGALFIYNQTRVSSPSAGGDAAQTYASEGVAAFNSRQFTVAVGLFNKEITASKNPSERALGYFNRATAYNAQHQYIKAISDFQSSTSLNGKNQNAWLDLGILEQRQGNTTQALSDYQKILALNPTDAGALFNAGILLYRSGSTAQGVSDIDKAISLNPRLVTQVPAEVKLK